MSVNNMSDFTARMPSDWTGVSGKIADTLNDIIETTEKTVKAVTEVSRVVGREGRLRQRAAAPNGRFTETHLSFHDQPLDVAQLLSLMAAAALAASYQRVG